MSANWLSDPITVRDMLIGLVASFVPLMVRTAVVLVRNAWRSRASSSGANEE